jgi:hypothetical protein
MDAGTILLIVGMPTLTLAAMLHTQYVTRRQERKELMMDILIPMFEKLIKDGAISSYVIKDGEQHLRTANEELNAMLNRMKHNK